MKWKVSNNERPTEEGFYYTVDSIGCKSVTEFARNHWYSTTGHPVVEWLDESPSPLSGEEIKPFDSAGEQDIELKRLYEWIMDENRKPAQTFFTAGWLRNCAREIEWRIKK